MCEDISIGDNVNIIGNKYLTAKEFANNIYVIPDGDILTHKCIMRTKRAIAFAEQVSDIYAYRPEKRFSDAVKGLHLYGASIVYPNEILAISCSIHTN